VTVRTLHHYDRIGLLGPEERSWSASYRRYGPGSVERLHRILSYRELGLSLDDIAACSTIPESIGWYTCAARSGSCAIGLAGSRRWSRPFA
jgi:MerR HTH family regulatory protein